MLIFDLNDQSYELNLLAVMLYSPDLIGTLSDDNMLTESDFVSQQNYEIYQGLLNYIKKFEKMEILAVDTDVLVECINEVCPKSKVRPFDIDNIRRKSSTAISVAGDPIAFYSQRVKNRAKRREFVEIAQHLSDDSRSMDISLPDIAGRTSNALDRLADTLKDNEPLFVPDPVVQIVNQFNLIKDGQKEDIQPTGFFSLDRVLGGGLRSGTLGVIAARPGCGKTSLGLLIALQIAEDQGNMGPAVFFSFEMTKESLFKKILCIYTKSSEQVLSEGITEQMRDDLKFHLSKAFFRNGKSFPGLLISEKSTVYLDEIERELKRMQSKNQLPKVCVFDYIQLMHTREKYDRRDLELGAITRGLRELAKKYGFCAILLCQMNRTVEGEKVTDDTAPNNSFIRDSGAIEQDADWVTFLLPSVTMGFTRCFFTKNRFGQISTKDTQLWFRFDGATSTFEESMRPMRIGGEGAHDNSRYNAAKGGSFGFSQYCGNKSKGE